MGTPSISRARTVVGRGLRRIGLLGPPRIDFTAEQMARLESLSERSVTRIQEAQTEVLKAVEALNPSTPGMEFYQRSAPSPQNAIDIFGGEWASSFPAGFGDLRAGSAGLFDDARVPWAIDKLGGVEGARIIELGPLEGGHTYSLDRAGAREIIAVEANTQAFLRCLVAKEIVGMPHASFICGDFERYLEQRLLRGEDKVDLCFASGILYHLRDPVATLDLITRTADSVFVWTMFYDEAYVNAREHVRAEFPSSVAADFQGFRYTAHRHEYQTALTHKVFYGGTAEYAVWLTREDIRRAMDHLGFDIVAEGFDGPEHDNGLGPSFAFAARRRA